MTYGDFITQIWKEVAKCPKSWRRGQSVFNVIEEQFGSIARDVQFIDGVDCFYRDDDETINLFIDHAWIRYASNQHPITQREE
jgi:hypothetical protein